MANYYLLDTGKNMTSLAISIEKNLKKNGHHVLFYLTDADGLLCLEEITEDEFLDHYSNNNKKTKEQ
jgi:hypothetical protein